MKRRAKSRSPRKSAVARSHPRSADRGARSAEPAHRWTFLSNHAHVLVCLARQPDIRLREVAERIGITERAVSNIIADLESENLLRRHRDGRCNSYELRLDQPLRHPLERHCSVAELVELILE